MGSIDGYVFTTHTYIHTYIHTYLSQLRRVCVAPRLSATITCYTYSTLLKLILTVLSLYIDCDNVYSLQETFCILVIFVDFVS